MSWAWLASGVLLVSMGLLPACGRTPPVKPAAAPPHLPGPVAERIYGVTVDSTDNLPDILEALSRLKRVPTTRVVFDADVPPEAYEKSVRAIHDVGPVMGELLDSYYAASYSPERYRARVAEYLRVLGPYVDIWEVGNEVNGEWLGSTPSVVAQIEGAFDLVKSQGKLAALTLYYNEGCAEPGHEMFPWVQKHLSSRIREGVDYLLVSYYEDDCDGRQPDWEAVFHRLAELFPTARLGIGECGTDVEDKKEEYLRRYYDMRLNEPRFVGGFFWWYFKQDMVPYTQPLWKVLNEVIARQESEPRGSGPRGTTAPRPAP